MAVQGGNVRVRVRVGGPVPVTITDGGRWGRLREARWRSGSYMPLGEVLQVKLKLLSLGPSLCSAGWLDSMSRLGDFPAPGAARCPRTNSLEQSSRDRPAFEPSSAPSATPAIRPRGLVNAVNARPCDLGAEMLDYQKIRGSRKIITIRIFRLDQMHPTVQRIIILRWILRMAREELWPFSVSVGHCIQAKLSWPLMNSPRCADSSMPSDILEP